jgi:hypothetical protein
MDTEQTRGSAPCPACGLADGEHLALCANRGVAPNPPRRLPMPGLTSLSIVLGTTEVVRPVADNSPGEEIRALFELRDDADEATARPDPSE